MNGKIILLIGVRGSGKDFFAGEIYSRDTKNSEIIGFSDSVREYCWRALGWQPHGDFEYEKFKESEISFTIYGEKHILTGREFLTNIGDQVMKKYDPDVWAKCWYQKVQEAIIKKNKAVIIGHDLRHINEYNIALKVAEIFKFDLKVYFCNYNSPRYEVSDHPSEALAVEILNTERFYHRDDITNYMKANYEY